jgi:hypothetical protein
MFNLLQNDSDKVIVFDFRLILDFLKFQVDHNLKNDTSIPMDFDKQLMLDEDC